MRTGRTLPRSTPSRSINYPSRSDQRAVFGTSLRALANDVKFKTYEHRSQRYVLLDGIHAAPGLGHHRCLPQLLRPVARRAAILRRKRGQLPPTGPRFTIPRSRSWVVSARSSHTSVADSTNPLYAPFTRCRRRFLPRSSEAPSTRKLVASIRDVIAPAYAKSMRFMAVRIHPATRTTLAANAMPDGLAYYKAMIEKFTTST